MSVRPGPRSGAALLVLLGGLLVALQVVLRGDGDIWTQVVGQCVAFMLFLPAAALCWRGLGTHRVGVVLVLVFALAFRAAAFEPGETPPLSTDVHRYAWDARVQAAGINPYRYAPRDPALAHLRDEEVWPGINLKSWRTVYPPGAEASFLTARGIFGTGLHSSTWLFLLAEAGAVALLLLVLRREGAPLERVALYAWHPLAVSEIAANGHVDALTGPALAGLLAAWQARRFALAGVALALGALVKLGPVLLFPALARRGGRRFLLAGAAVGVAAYLPYLSVGAGVVGSIGRYVDRQHFGGSLWPLLSDHLSDTAAKTLLAVVLAAVVALVALREHAALEQVARSALLLLGTLLLVLGYVQPWHALWLVPFFVLTVAPGWLWLTGTLPLLYLFDLEWSLPTWVRVVVYGPLALWVAWRVLAARRRSIPLAPLTRRPQVAAVIPALNEGEALPRVLREFPAGVVDEVLVVDGGSRDGTVDAAREAGARVLVEARRGYGRACAVGAASTDADVIVFLDGDGSDDPAYLPDLLEPILAGGAALSLGARIEREPGALFPHQLLGNRLVALLVRLVYGVRLRDIPPMRAARRDVLERLALTEMTYGWPTEMIVKTARTGLPIAEVEVGCRARRGGESKIAGRALPSALAGARMLAVVARYA
ncbi:MAG: glycosyltransferase family 2 protein [Gaiellaceae bacterium]